MSSEVHSDRFLQCSVLLCLSAGVGLMAPRAHAASEFLRGDVDESIRLEVTDAIRIFQFLFLGQGEAVSCLDAADANDNGVVELTDGILILNYLFRRGSPPAEPFPACGSDPTDDALACERHEGCELAFDFFGKSLSADGVFFAIDRSGTMQDSGGLKIAKQEMVRVLGDFSERVQFGIVFFNSNVIKFPASGVPAVASPELKMAATKFVESTLGGSGTCVEKGLLAAVSFAHASTAARNIIVYVGDGGGTCGGPDEEAVYLRKTVDSVTAANAGRARIYTIGVQTVGRVAETFLEDLAARNGGTFTKVNR